MDATAQWWVPAGHPRHTRAHHDGEAVGGSLPHGLTRVRSFTNHNMFSHVFPCFFCIFHDLHVITCVLFMFKRKRSFTQFGWRKTSAIEKALQAKCFLQAKSCWVASALSRKFGACTGKLHASNLRIWLAKKTFNLKKFYLFAMVSLSPFFAT